MQILALVEGTCGTAANKAGTRQCLCHFFWNGVKILEYAGSQHVLQLS